jgi:hypothetical protein
VITVVTIWDAYRALHRYVAAPVGTVRVGATWVAPAHSDRCAALAPDVKLFRVRDALPSDGKSRAAADQLAAVSALLPATHPIAASDEYYAYLFLFAQLIRCSGRLHPHFVTPQVGWKNLRWVSIEGLRGTGDAPLAFWNKFYWQHVQIAKPAPDETALRIMFPLPPEAKEQTAAVIDAQLDALLDAMECHHMSADQIFVNCNRLGRIRKTEADQTDPSLQWLPLLIAARPESYWPLNEHGSLAAQNSAVQEVIRQLLASPKQLRTFLDHTAPYCNGDTAETKARPTLWAELHDGFADVVEHTQDRALRAVWMKREPMFSASKESDRDE